MADLTITASAIIGASDAVIKDGTAGATITQGQAVYLDSATSTYKLADNDASAATADAIGISLVSTLSGQPIKVIVGGTLAFGAILTAGSPYYLSDTAGAICPFSDLSTPQRVVRLGDATSTSNMVIRVYNTGVTL